MKYSFVVALILCVVLVPGCQGTAVPKPASPPSGTPSSPAQPPSGNLPPQSTTQVQGTPESKFFLEIVEPQDAALVKTSTVRVRGTTLPDAEVRVNDQFVIVDQAGNFTVMVSLEIGPNNIEIIASDESGDEEYRLLTVMYLP